MKIGIVSSGMVPLPVLRGGSVDAYSYYIAKSLAELNQDIILYCNKYSRIEVKRIISIKNKIPPINSKTINQLIFNSFVFFDVFKRRKELDVVHTNTSLSTLFLSKIFKNIVFTSHSAYWWRSEKTHRRQIEATRKARVSIAISKFIENKMKKYNKNTFYVPNGVDTQLYKPIPFNKKKLESTILSVGSITEQKGLIYLAKAMSHIVREKKEVKWVHVGPGNQTKNPYYRCLLDFIKKHNLAEHVLFTGSVPLKKLLWYYQNATLFVLPSLWEGMPLVVLEAMSCGLPVFASDINGVNEMLQEEFLFPPANVNQLEKIILLNIQDKQNLRKIGALNRKFVEKNFSWSVIAKKLLDIYRSVI